jgi:hypothetical protein
MVFAASVLAVQLAAAPAAATPAVPPQPAVAQDWAAAPMPSREHIAIAVREAVAEEKAKQAEVPRRHEDDTLRGDKFASFAASFDDAKVPDCLHADGLKRQPPRIGIIALPGLLGLPFVLLAKMRGKCL